MGHPAGLHLPANRRAICPTDAASGARGAGVAAVFRLNAERAAEEALGTVRWLRPEFQDPARRGSVATPVATQDEMDLDPIEAAWPATLKGRRKTVATTAVATSPKSPWPNTLPEQMRGVAGVLAASARPIAVEAVESAFTGRGAWKRRISPILDALAAVGRAREVDGLWTAT